MQGEKEAEKMIVESYAALLLAFLSTERFVHHIKYFFPQFAVLYIFSEGKFSSAACSKGTRDAIADCLPDHNLRILVPVLDQFLVCIFYVLISSPFQNK